MTIYLVKGYIDVAATSLADAQALLGALADPSDADNVAIIDRVTGKLETLVQSDTGEPLTISSIDSTAGTISSWVTDSDVSLAVGLGDPDPNQGFTYASTTSFSIVSSTRTGTLALNTAALTSRLVGRITNRGIYAGASALNTGSYTLHIRKTSVSGTTETLALLSVRVQPGVLAASAADDVAEVSPSAVRARPAITSLTGGGATALDGLETADDALPDYYTVLLSISRVGTTWQLTPGTDAENVSIGIVRPDDYDGSTNARIWVQL